MPTPPLPKGVAMAAIVLTFDIKLALIKVLAFGHLRMNEGFDTKAIDL